MGTIAKKEVPEYLLGENQYETEHNVQLYDAATKGNYAALKKALESGANPNFISKSGEQLGTLHAAGRKGSGDCVKALISSGARVSAALVSNRNEPVHEAAQVGATDVVSVLVEASPKCMQSENVYGNTCLHAAVRSGSADIVALLLDRGAAPNARNHRGSTPLHLACFLCSNNNESTPGADPFLKIGALLLCNDELEIDIADVNGYTPLHCASQRGCNAMVKLLIDSGASLTAKTGVDSKGRGARTPAGMAKFGGHDSTQKILDDAAVAGGEVITKKMAKKILEDEQ